MRSFPRLTALFGAPVDALDESAIQSAIDSRIPEDVDLDWKEAHYPKDKNPELAMDVAQLANTMGGSSSWASKNKTAAPTHRTPCHSATTKNDASATWVSARIRPFLPGVSFRSIETSADMGYLVIVVPQSADAPHAVVQEWRAGVRSARWLEDAMAI